MERLTRRWGPEEKQILGHAICEFNHCPEDTTCASCVYGQKNNRLADIEDILGDNYDLDRLQELIQADREGRCVVLPVKPGETFYAIDRVRTLCHLGYYFDDYDCQGCEEEICDAGLSLEVIKRAGYSRSQALSFIDDKKKIYLSEQEAESALKAMKERGKK